MILFKTEPGVPSVVVEAPCCSPLCRRFVPVVAGRIAAHIDSVGNRCEWTGMGIVFDDAGYAPHGDPDDAGRITWGLISAIAEKPDPKTE
ncbi:hypothetical protein D5S18_25985 [Nocardia panacis]|uniref:Uncharacterized protein n=1 Tax=Nocardia panacis TaxID=2340916 RepID=A0A3A4K2K3_9NOCA|nr:hypothetical protein D5S18_25985 [Nocardia panacis]